MLEARQHARAELALELLQRVAQEAPRTALPRRSVGLDDVAEHELQRREAAARPSRVPVAARSAPTRTCVSGSGSRRRSPVEPNGCGLGERTERRERVVGGHPADARVAAARRARTRAASVRARSRRGRSTPARPARRRSTSASPCIGVTVPLSQMPFAQPEPRARPRARARRRRSASDDDHAARRACPGARSARGEAAPAAAGARRRCPSEG